MSLGWFDDLSPSSRSARSSFLAFALALVAFAGASEARADGPPPAPDGAVFPPSPPPPPPSSATAPGIVRLHVESPVPVQIYRHIDSFGYFGRHELVLDTPIPVCASPCDVPVDGTLGQEFSAAGPEANESPRFSLIGR
jgi:hypothetical protein